MHKQVAVAAGMCRIPTRRFAGLRDTQYVAAELLPQIVRTVSAAEKSQGVAQPRAS